MRNYLFSMLTAIALIVSCQWANAQTISLVNENFDGITEDVPDGWNNGAYSCAASYIWQSDAAGYNGTRGMKFNTYSASSGTYSALMTPVLNLNAPFTLRFKYQNYNAGTLDVRISLDGGVTYSTVIEAGLTTSTASEWLEKEISLTPYIGNSNVRIVFYSTSNYGYQRQYLDDVVIETAPTCKAPDGLFVTNLSTNTADLNWGLSLDGDNPTLYQVTVTDEHGTTVYTNNNVPGTSISLPLTGLSPNTTYSVRMRSNCDNTLGGNSKYASLSFTTACVPSSLPYEENFDALSGLPACTYSLNAGIEISNKYGTTGKSMKLTSNASENAYVVYPCINHAANDLQVTLFGKSSISTPLQYAIGIVTDIGDIEGSFIPLHMDSLSSSAGWKEIRMNTSASPVTTAPVYVCVFIGGGTAATLYIDNVSIVPIPTCVRPEQLRAYNPTFSSIDLSWTTNVNAAQYLIDVTDLEAGTTSVFTATTQPCTVTGLQSNTQYSFRLHAVCSPGDTSEYAPTTVTATTLCAPSPSATWLEDAEKTSGTDLPDCWIYGYFNRTTTGTSYDQPFQTQTSTVHNGSRGFMLRSMASGNSSFLTSPGFTIDQANVYQAAIWIYRSAGTTSVGEGLHLYASNNPDNLTNAQDLGFINRCVGNSPVEADGAGWYRYELPISKTGVVYLIIEGVSKNGQATYFDDVQVELAPTCNKPGIVSAGTPTTTDIPLSWTAGTNNETSWAIAYELVNGGIVVGSDSQVVSTPAYTVTGLAAASNYTLRARVYAICSPTDMSAARRFSTTFSTPCGVISNFPYMQDFEGGTMPPACWSQKVLSGSNSWSTSSSQKHAGTYSAYIQDKSAGAKTAIMTGELNFSSPNGYQVSFWMYRGSSYQTKTDEAIHVFVSPTDSLDETTAVEIGVVNQHYLNAPAEPTYGWYKYTFDVPLSVTGTQYVSFCYHNQYGTGAYIDDIMIREAPTCRDLNDPNVSDIQPNSAKITLNPVDTGVTDWDISYGPTGTAPASGTIVNVTGGARNYVITGLTADQSYDVYVRRNCGTEVGDWTLSPVNFTAVCTDLVPTTSGVDAYQFVVKADAASWDLSFGPSGTTPTTGSIISVTADSIILDGLTPATSYVYYVRRDCGSGVYSDWSDSVSVRTTVVPDSLPLGTGFEDDDDNAQWTIANGTGDNYFTFGSDANGVRSGSKALYISNGGAYSYDNGSSTKTYAYRTIYFEPYVTHVSFMWKCTGGESSYDFGRVMLVPASEALTPGSGTSYSGTTFPNFTFAFDPEGANKMNLTTGDADGWNLYEADIDMTNKPAGVYNFVVMWSNDGSVGSDYPISIDNLSISRVSCVKPTVLSGSTTSTGTTITVGTQTAPEWEIVVSDSAIDIYGTVTGNIYQQISSGPAVLTGLTANTPYYYTARAICGPGDTSNWATVQIVRTACDAMDVPYTENFEDAGALNCWTSFGDNTPSRNTTVKYAGLGSCKIVNTTAVSPVLDIVTLETYMLNGFVRSSADSIYFSVGVMLDPEDPSTYEQLGQDILIPAKNTWQEFTTYFTDLADFLEDEDLAPLYFSQHFAIAVANVSADVYFDNLYLGSTPTCPKPTNTSITNVLGRSFDLSWTENGTATSWRINAIPTTAGQRTISQVVTTNPVTISGLNPVSSYTVQIQSLCDASDSSLLTECGTITTACDIVNPPYEEDFELQTGNTVATCWDNSASTTSTITGSYPTPYYVWGVYENGGNKMLRMYNWMVSSGTATINMPIVALDAGKNYTFDFDYCHQASCGNMTVDISTDGGSSWNNLGTYSASGSSTSYSTPASWTPVSLNISAYAGNNVVIRFYSTANYGNGAIFIDNIKLLEARSCMAPSALVATNVGANSVDVSWNAGTTETEWQVIALNGADTVFNQFTTTESCTVTGLNPTTNYSIKVAAICGVGDTSYFCSPISVLTACGTFNTPYVEDFENQTVSAIPMCWDNSASSASATASYPYYKWGVYQSGSNNMIRMYNSLVHAGDVVINSPQIVLAPGANYALTFDYCHQASCGDITVSASTDGGTIWNTLGTYAKVGTGSSAITPASWTNVSTNLSAYAGNTIMIRFACTANYGSGAVFIDNVKVKQLRNCLDIVNFSVNPSDVYADVTIRDTVSTHSQWQYRVVAAGADTTGVTPVLVSDSAFSVTGLSAVTAYDIYVRAYCDATEQSDWMKKSFTTSSTPAPMPYICQFTDSAENAQWRAATYYANSNYFTIGAEPAALSPGNTAALYISDGTGYAYSISNSTSTAAYRLFHFNAAQYYVSFSWKCTGGESSFDYARFYLAPETGSVYLPSPGSYQTTGWPTGLVALDGGTKKNLASPEWNNVDMIIDMTNRPGNYNLIFLWSNDGSVGSQAPLAINDIAISEITCNPLTAVSVPDSTITLTEAVVYCSNPNQGSDLLYWVNTTGLRTDTLISGTVSDTSFTISGLDPSTKYYLYVAAQCSETDESPAFKTSFSTACGTISTFPYTQDFEGDWAPTCWTPSAATTQNRMIWAQYSTTASSSGYIHSGRHSAYLTNGSAGKTALLATPEFTFDSLREYYVSFFMYRATSTYYTDAVKVYLSDDPNSVTGATLLNTTTCTGAPGSAGMYEVVVDLPQGTTGNKYIIFVGQYNYYGYVYIDDVTVGMYPVCRDLNGVTVDATTAHTMTVSANKGINHLGIIFAYAPDTAVSVADTIGSVYSTTGSAVIQGLDSMTTFKVFARGVCAENDSTAWTAPATGTTQASDCYEPQNLQIIGAVQCNTVTLAWGPALDAIAYEYECVGTTITDIIYGDTLVLTGLNPMTTYNFRVRTLCSYDTTAWVSLQFTTPRTPAPLPYVCEFEDGSENAEWDILNGSQTNQFIVGSATSNGGVASLYVSNDGSNNAYTASSASVVFATRFFQLPAGEYAYSYDWNCLGESSYDYGRVFLAPSNIVLTPGSLPTSVSTTGVPAGSFALDGNSKLNQVSGWQNVSGTFDVASEGTYLLVVLWRNDGSVGNNPPFAIDNINIRALTCRSVTASVVESSITQTSATISIDNPNETNTVIYSVSYSSLAEAFLTDTVVGQTSISLAGLTSSSSINVYLKAYCGEDDESFTSTVTFRTLCGQTVLPYTESFESFEVSQYAPGMIEEICWKDLNAGEIDEWGYADYPYYTASGSYTTDGNKSLYMYDSYNTGEYLHLIMPSFGNINNCRLTFDYGITSNNGNGLVVGYMTNASDANSFVQVYAASAAQTYTMYPQTVDIANIPAGARIAFKYNAPSYGAAYLDNIRVIQLVSGPTYSESICYDDPYTNYGFSVPSDDIKVGQNQFTRIKSGAAGTPDTLITANVFKRDRIQNLRYDTVCQGQPFVWEGHTITNPTTRIYTLPTLQAACGCDSLVSTFLTVLSTYREFNDTICQGSSYPFHGQNLTQAGDYPHIELNVKGCSDTTILHLAVVAVRDTLNEDICKGTSFVWHGQQYSTAGTYTWTGTGLHGCPLTEVLNLNVLDGDSTINKTICHGGSYLFRDTLITTAGTYVRSYFDSQLGCQITLTLNATIAPIITSTFSDVACEGHPYYGYGISGLTITKDTTVIRNTQTADLCDSTATINLTFVATKYTDLYPKIVQGDIYYWNDLPFTEEGDYPQTLQSSEGCDSIVTIHLSYKGAGVETISDINMTIVPNPVNAGATSFVYGEFGEVENVEILNNFGQVIDRFVPETYPIEVSGISASGLYYVRVTTKSGSVLLKKLIVK